MPLRRPPTRPTESFHPKSRGEWRAWLQKNHATSNGVWLIYDKKSAGRTRNLSYADAVEEALCFGWIDNIPNKIDDATYKQAFTPRRPGSGWSPLNKRRIKRLIASGLMTPAGMAKIAAAKKDGSWTALDALERLTVPADLSKALAKNKKAAAAFETLAPSVRRGRLWWIESAKKAETRAKRVRETVEYCAGRGATGRE